MKFIHTSDLHIGRTINTNSLIEDQKFILDQISSIIMKEKPDLVIISGDVYDKSVPSAQAVLLFNDFITSIIMEYKIKVAVIPGNHDSNDRLSFGSEVLKSNGLYIFTKLEDINKPIVVSDLHGEVNIYCIPFFSPVYIKSYLDNDPDIINFETAYIKLVKGITLDRSKRNIAVAHAFITGCEISDDSEMPLSVGGSEEISAEVFKDFNYTALGHLHKFQKAGNNAVYSGSPLKYSFSEVKHEKVILLCEMNEKGDVDIENIPLTPLRDMRVIEGTFDELVEYAEDDDKKSDYIKIKLSDSVSIFDPVNRLKKYYPNILELEFTKFNFNTDRLVKGLSGEMRQLSVPDKFAVFYKDVSGEDIDDEYKRFFEDLYSQFSEVKD